MTYRLIMLSEIEIKEHEQKFGRYNDYPPNWKECDPDYFWHVFNVYGTGHIQEHRQMFLRNGEDVEHSDANLFFYMDGRGLAMVKNYDRAAHKFLAPKLFQFALCEHDKVSVPEKSRMCYHVSRCTKCHEEFVIDSSD